MGGPERVRGRVGILPGSFKPAHHRSPGVGPGRPGAGSTWTTVVFSLSSAIVDKERLEGLCREDRLLLMRLLAQDHPWVAVAVVNRGLYSEQAPAFRAVFGHAAGLSFIVGMDKVLQIFDPKYYDDRAPRPGRAVRPRAGSSPPIGRVGAVRICGRSWNGPRIFPTGTGSKRWRYPSISRTSPPARCGAASRAHGPGRMRFLGWRGEFIAATGAFRDRYDLRVAAIDALYPVRQWAEAEVPLEPLLARAAEPGEAGGDGAWSAAQPDAAGAPHGAGFGVSA